MTFSDRCRNFFSDVADCVWPGIAVIAVVAVLAFIALSFIVEAAFIVETPGPVVQDKGFLTEGPAAPREPTIEEIQEETKALQDETARFRLETDEIVKGTQEMLVGLREIELRTQLVLRQNRELELELQLLKARDKEQKERLEALRKRVYGATHDVDAEVSAEDEDTECVYVLWGLDGEPLYLPAGYSATSPTNQ